MPFTRSLEEASSSYLFVATDPRYENVVGKFIVDCKEILSSDESYDEEKAQRLWEASCKWCGLEYKSSGLEEIVKQSQTKPKQAPITAIVEKYPYFDCKRAFQCRSVLYQDQASFDRSRLVTTKVGS